MTFDELLTATEAAKRLGTTTSTLNRWAAAGKIPTAHKLPGERGARRFDPDVVAAFAADMDVAA